MPLIINGRAIEDAVLDAEFSQIKSYHERTSNVSCCERDPEFRQTARENVVGRVLLTEEALRVIDPPAAEEVDAALERLKTEHGGEGHFYAAMGIAPDQVGLVKQDLEVSLRVNKLLERLVEDEAEPAEPELRAFYEEHIASFTDPEQRRASHISKGVSRMASREGLLDEFAAVREQLMDGGDFEALAKAHSDRGTDLVDLGLFRRGDLPEEVELVAFTMRVGEISPVFSSSVGLHIVKLTEIKPSAARPFEGARDEVKRMFMEQRKRERAQELVKRLEKTAVVEELPAEVGQEDGEVSAMH
ncbi:MAG: prsA1 [Phycisphaerales bacterium]|nr:prsA1 [Phycisphaerales bacterium]